MNTSLIIPQIGLKSNSTKDNIILILSNEWPLSAKEIYFEVQKNSLKEITYQAVHKTILQLEEEGIIERNHKQIQLKKTWIEQSKKFFSNLTTTYSNSNGKYKIDQNFNGVIKLKFDDISIFAVTMAEFFANKTLIKEGDPSPIGILRHAWWPTRFKFSDFGLLLRVLKNNIGGMGGFVITKLSSPFDKWILNQYLLGGFKNCKSGVEIEGLEDDFFIHGDVILQARLSEDTKQLMDKYYNKISNIQDLYNFYTKGNKLPKADINLTIFRNQQLAETLRKMVKKQFEGGKTNFKPNSSKN